MDFQRYFETKSLIKKPRIGVHYEQKITPDLLWAVAHVILDLIKNDEDLIFSDKEVRKSPVFNYLMQEYFSKPPQDKAENEYNKVSSYQLGLMAFAGILEQVAIRPKRYRVRNKKALEYIAVNDLNASKFLGEYTEKFIKDNGFTKIFDNYRKNSNQSNYIKAKEAYWHWAVEYTAVRGTNRDHTYRVFNKIFNVFCYKNRLPGEDASNIKPGVCPYAWLIYNRQNFRDKDKPQGITRQEYRDEILSEIEKGGVTETLLKKAKDSVRIKYNNESEIKDPSLGYMQDSGVHVHHMLPLHSYPQFSLSKENLISLTPGQHLSLAHVRGNTKTINPEFQIICLKKKFDQIKTSITNGENFYNLNVFIKILNTIFGWEIDEKVSIEKVSSLLDSV